MTADPEVTRAVLTHEDEFLVLASDGVWDVMSDEDAVGLVHDTVKDPAMVRRAACSALPPVLLLFMVVG